MKIKIVHILKNIFFTNNLSDILTLRNEYRIHGNLFLFSSFFFKNEMFLMFSFEEILIGIEFGFISFEKVYFKKKNNKKLFLTKFYSEKINLKKKFISYSETSHRFSIRNWRENFFVIITILKNQPKKKKNHIKKNFLELKIHVSDKYKEKKAQLIFFIKNFRAIKFIDYIAFRDLWMRGFFVTCGIKFGASFLVYAGNIEIFHACLSIFLLKPFDFFFSVDFVSFGRVGTSTKKRTLIGYLTKNLFINYCTIKWINAIP